MDFFSLFLSMRFRYVRLKETEKVKLFASFWKSCLHRNYRVGFHAFIDENYFNVI